MTKTIENGLGVLVSLCFLIFVASLAAVIAGFGTALLTNTFIINPFLSGVVHPLNAPEGLMVYIWFVVMRMATGWAT